MERELIRALVAHLDSIDRLHEWTFAIDDNKTIITESNVGHTQTDDFHIPRIQLNADGTVERNMASHYQPKHQQVVLDSFIKDFELKAI